MIDNCENLFYTYLDECKKNFLTDCMKENGDTFEEYSITSFTFNKKSYQEVFEKEWTKLRSKYNKSINLCSSFYPENVWKIFEEQFYFCSGCLSRFYTK